MLFRIGSKKYRLNIQKMHNAVLMGLCVFGMTMMCLGLWAFACLSVAFLG